MPRGIYIHQPLTDIHKARIGYANLGNVPWNKGMTGIYKPETIKRISEANKDEKHPQWKGGKVGYLALHQWVARKLGNPKKCEHCEKLDAKRYDWANVSGEYKRELTDWIRLCRKCHIQYDKNKCTR